MKFARYLEENTVPEWKKVYIQYRGLKKLIKRVAEHREARLEYERLSFQQQQQQDSSQQQAASLNTASSQQRFNGGLQPAVTISNDDSVFRKRWRSGSVGRNVAPSSKPETDRELDEVLARLKPVSLKGTGLRLSDQDPDESDPNHLDSSSDVEARPSHHLAAPPLLTNPHPSLPISEEPMEMEEADVGGGAADQTLRGSTKTLHDGRGDVTTLKDLKDGFQASLKETGNPEKAPSVPESPTSIRNNGSNRGGRNRGLSRSSSVLSKARRKVQYPETLEGLLEVAFDEEEAKFFLAADNELEKIVDFYAAREAEAAKRHLQLVRQLKELADHRREYRAKYGLHESNSSSAQANQTLSKLGLGKILNWEGGFKGGQQHQDPSGKGGREKSSTSKGSKERGDAERERHGFPSETEVDSAPPPPSPGLAGVDESASASAAQDEGDKRRAAALAKMQARLEGWDDEEDYNTRQENRRAAMSHDPEAYYAARKKLKAAVLEYYKFLETLSNYKILNRTGFAKIMKKFSKTVDVPCADAYFKAKVAPSILVTSDRLEKLLKSTEEVFTAYFEHGNRKKALSRLRVREDDSTHHFSVFRSGFYLGISLCATVAGLVEAMKRDVPEWQSLLRVYGAEFIPTLFALLFGLNLLEWHGARINTVFIFEWDVRHSLDYRQYFEIPSLLMLLLSLCFWLSFLNPFQHAIAPTTWPTVWLVIVLVVLLNPLPIMSRDSRKWFVKSILRVFAAGLTRVEFRDFFLGDELNSVAWSISTLWFLGCKWNSSWKASCSPNSTYWTSALVSLPALLRLGQCVRRWVDSDCKTHLHLVNAGKYASAILNAFFYIHYRLRGSSDKVDLAVWCIFGTIYSTWHILWDLIMDWSLLRPRSEHFLLRNELSFHWSRYYLAITVDVILRFSWIIYLLPGPSSVLLRSFLVALLEMLRRVNWNLFRLENEHLGNIDSFKIVRDLPLPYRQKHFVAQDVVKEDGGEVDVSKVELEKHDLGGGGFGVNDTVIKMKNLIKGKKGKPSVESDKEGDGSKRKGPRTLESSRVEENLEGRTRGEEGEEQSLGANAERKKSKDSSTTKLLIAIRDKLVPDGDQGPFTYGERIDQRAATKGDKARDYAPRQLEIEADVSGEDEEGEVSTPFESDAEGVLVSTGQSNVTASDREGSRRRRREKIRRKEEELERIERQG